MNRPIPLNKNMRRWDGFARHGRFWFVFIGTMALSLVVMYIHMTNGTFQMSTMDVLRTLFRVEAVREHQLILFEFRLPRIVIGAMVGFALGVAGAVLQGMTRNPLADPGILGINAAVGMAIVLYMFFFHGTMKDPSWWSTLTMPFFGWIGGMIASVLLILFARERGTLDPQRFILAGIAFSSGFGAVTLYVSLKMAPQDFEMAAVWLTGSIYGANWTQIIAIFPWFLFIIPIVLRKSHTLNLLQLDDVSVTGIGMRKDRERFLFLICSIGLVSTCVAVSGNIGFVGLIAPHIARRLVGHPYQFVVPAGGAIGMLMVLLGDFLGKTVFAPAELPAGIVISIIGVPYFVYLLFKTRKSN